jgi:hypothetical protein
MEDRANHFPLFHHWRIRMFVGFFMVCLAFIGLILTELYEDGAWHYWRGLCIVYACLSIGMNCFTRRKEAHRLTANIWHEIMHWMGLFFAVMVLSIMVEIGMMGRFLSSILVLLLLAFSTYLAGVYTDITLLFVGLLIGLFAFGLSIISAYLYPVLIPITGLCLLFLYLYLKRQHRRHAINN